ncbi:coat protein [Tanacetum coccineum]
MYFNPDQNLPVTKGTPVNEFKDIFYYGIRNHVVLEATGDPTREAVVYTYIAASLLRLFTKPASNYVSSWSGIVKSFSKFYDKPMNVALPNPVKLALKTTESRLAFGKAEKVTLYLFLYMRNLNESHKDLKKFLYDTYLLHYGLTDRVKGYCVRKA